jgi:hypothetical protein
MQQFMAFIYFGSGKNRSFNVALIFPQLEIDV